MTLDITRRRGFVVGVSCSVLSLYGLWALLDRPTGGLRETAGEGGHAGHGAHGGATGALSPGDFRALAEEFIVANSLPDGSVRPGAAHDPTDHGDHGPDEAVSAPLEVYLMATRWQFEPANLRLTAGQVYRFRMMSLDVGHGASIQLGRGSHMIRLPVGVLNEQLLTFTRPGKYLLYCTKFCGPGHDMMSGRILVDA